MLSSTNLVSWDDEQFLLSYKTYKEYLKSNPYIYSKIRELRIAVYTNTIALVQQGFYINKQGERISLSHEKGGTDCFYSQEIDNSSIPKQHYESCETTVLDDDCLAVAIRLKKEGLNPAVLNMANRQNPGGGVTKGAGAQEETIFRRTDIFRSLYQYAPYAKQYGLHQAPEQYPMDVNFGGIYTPDALVFREDEENGYRLMDEPTSLAFITVAGLMRPALTPENRIASHFLITTIKDKIRTILRIGVRHQHDSLVLGALGCGAFCNPPAHIAELFYETLREPEFQGAFRKVVFAIIDDHNAYHAHNPQGNFKPFVEVFQCS